MTFNKYNILATFGLCVAITISILLGIYGQEEINNEEGIIVISVNTVNVLSILIVLSFYEFIKENSHFRMILGLLGAIIQGFCLGFAITSVLRRGINNITVLYVLDFIYVCLFAIMVVYIVILKIYNWCNYMCCSRRVNNYENFRV